MILVLASIFNSTVSSGPSKLFHPHAQVQLENWTHPAGEVTQQPRSSDGARGRFHGRRRWETLVTRRVVRRRSIDRSMNSRARVESAGSNGSSGVGHGQAVKATEMSLMKGGQTKRGGKGSDRSGRLSFFEEQQTEADRAKEERRAKKAETLYLQFLKKVKREKAIERAAKKSDRSTRKMKGGDGGNTSRSRKSI